MADIKLTIPEFKYDAGEVTTRCGFPVSTAGETITIHADRELTAAEIDAIRQSLLLLVAENPPTKAEQEATTAVVERTAVQAAIANLKAYLDLSSPTAVQTAGVTKLLCRVALVLIRRVMALS